MLLHNRTTRSILLSLFVLVNGILFADSQLVTAHSRTNLQESTPPAMPQPATSYSETPSDSDQLDLVEATSNQFLTLPFNYHSDMRVIQGWIYTWGGAHLGIDYIRGSGRTFDVVAAADGEACGNCVDGPGNKVWIKHTVGNTIYYTYYGHLATIEPGIPLWSGASKKVTRGQKIGTAGNTGTSLIHLHFAVYNASWAAVDPYALYSTYPPYFPNSNYKSMGANYLFTQNPPLYPSQAEISQPTETNLPVSNYLPLILRRIRR